MPTLAIRLRRDGFVGTLEPMPGLPARPPMERLIRIICSLRAAGPAGRSAERLAEIAGWSDAADPASQLAREFRQIKDLGWEIENIAGEGGDGVYRLRAYDARLRVQLDERQRTELRRAAILADRADIADRLDLDPGRATDDVAAAYNATPKRDGALDTVLNAIRIGATVSFRYKGTDRLLHPGAVRTQNTKWYLLGAEDGSEQVKQFVVDRMSQVKMGHAHSARHVEVPRMSLHPMRWEVDPPVDVTLRVPADYMPDVRRWLMEPSSQSADGDVVEMTYRCTNEEALRHRIYLLGPRVTVVGPAPFRKSMLAELSTMAGE